MKCQRRVHTDKRLRNGASAMRACQKAVAAVVVTRNPHPQGEYESRSAYCAAHAIEAIEAVGDRLASVEIIDGPTPQESYGAVAAEMPFDFEDGTAEEALAGLDEMIVASARAYAEAHSLPFPPPPSSEWIAQVQSW